MRGRVPRLFTIRNARRSPEGFVTLLNERGVRRVVDVRALPMSRRKGFSKTKLKEALEGAGIEYVHLRDAGNSFRHEAATDIKRCLSLYTGHICLGFNG